MPPIDPAEPCALHRVHHPSVANYVTLRLDGDAIELCPTGFHNVMAYAAYLRGNGAALRVKVGPETKVLAQRVLDSEALTGQRINTESPLARA